MPQRYNRDRTAARLTGHVPRNALYRADGRSNI
jgi:hypothetical protein